MGRSAVSPGLLILALALPAYPQVTLTGAIQFSTNATGVGTTTSEIWNTLGGDNRYDLWLALNADATSPVNGPSDAQVGIDITLAAGDTYKYYIFGAPGFSTGFDGLNLFFNGNNSTPGISAFGPTNGSQFQPDGNSTLTLAATSVAGSGRTFYRSGSVVAVLTGYDWNAPATPPGDVCQAYTFVPGGGVSLFGSFTLQAFPAASLSSSLSSASPGTEIKFAAPARAAAVRRER